MEDSYDLMGNFGLLSDPSSDVQGNSINALDRMTYSEPDSTFTVSGSGDSLSFGGYATSPAPATNGNSAQSGGTLSLSQFASGAKATADSLFGVFKDFTQFQIQKDQLQASAENAKLNYAVTSARNNSAAQIAEAQAARDAEVAKAQAQMAINSAQMRAQNALGISQMILPSSKMMTYATLIGLGIAIYSAFKHKG
jgi:hypothetical protein